MNLWSRNIWSKNPDFYGLESDENWLIDRHLSSEKPGNQWNNNADNNHGGHRKVQLESRFVDDDVAGKTAKGNSADIGKEKPHNDDGKSDDD